jgi:hypothetical protein
MFEFKNHNLKAKYTTNKPAPEFVVLRNDSYMTSLVDERVNALCR